ncbi:MAG TPA: hypothetical protein VHS28_05920, partial [Chloroflexota bacterium]|nr:hypothetical protein [Chloroflexota bacterium]
CYVTLHMPYPAYPRDAAAREFWGDSLVGYQPVVLNGSVAVKESLIYWRLADRMLAWNITRVLSWLKETHNTGRLLAQLTLKGNYIFIGEGPERRYLDGEAFGTLSEDKKRTDIILPSGENRRGGDFEMWFWVTPGKKIGVPLKVAALNFIAAPAPTPLNVPPEKASSLGVLKMPPDTQRQIKLPGEEGVNVVEITFSHPILKETLVNNVRLERVGRISTSRFSEVPGDVVVVNETTVRFVVKDRQPLPRKGQYVLTIAGSSAENAPSVRAVDGTPLDGDFSDGPGGNMVLPFSVE